METSTVVSPSKPPPRASRAGAALVILDKWSYRCINLSPSPRRLNVRGDMWMEPQMRWELAHLFDCPREALWEKETWPMLVKKVPSLAQWSYQEHGAHLLLQRLTTMNAKINKKLPRHLEMVAKERAAHEKAAEAVRKEAHAARSEAEAIQKEAEATPKDADVARKEADAARNEAVAASEEALVIRDEARGLGADVSAIWPGFGEYS